MVTFREAKEHACVKVAQTVGAKVSAAAKSAVVVSSGAHGSVTS